MVCFQEKFTGKIGEKEKMRLKMCLQVHLAFFFLRPSGSPSGNLCGNNIYTILAVSHATFNGRDHYDS